MKKLSLLEIFGTEIPTTTEEPTTSTNEIDSMSVEQIAKSIEDTVETEVVMQEITNSSSLKNETIEEKTVLPSSNNKNTLGADINEILTGYYLVGGWKGFANAVEAKAQVDLRKAQVTPNEYNDQNGRAKAMANSVIAWAATNGYKGKPIKAWWTARPGVLSSAYGQPVDSKKNPTDILIKFSDGQFLGISAKSTKKSSGNIGFKNPGAGTVSRVLKIDLDSLFKNRTAIAIKKFKLPLNQNERKEFIRTNSKIKVKTVVIGQEILSSMRDAMFASLSKMKPSQLRAYILTYWMDADAVEPRYIKVTGNGNNGAYSASITDPLSNEKLQALSSPKLTVIKVGNDSVGIIGGNNKKIMKMRFKYESEKLASSLKLSGDPW